MTTLQILNKIDELENTLKCSVCSEIFENPTVIGQCGHTFCKKCIVANPNNECPACKVPVGSSDAHEDKQLCDLVSLVHKLKLIVKEQFPDQSNVENLDESRKCVIISETPLPGVDSNSGQERSSRTPKPAKCKAPSCVNTPGGCGSEEKHNEDFNMKTPKNFISKKRALSSPCLKTSTRTPVRFSTFSSKKFRSTSPRNNKLFSPVNIEKKNHKGETLLHMSVIKGDVQRVCELLAKGANPNIKDNAGWTPLHEASNHGYLEITKLLVDHGAMLNVPGHDNITPLHDAIMNGYMEIANFLASKGADIYAKTSFSNTAVDLCKTDADKESLVKSFNIVSKPVSVPQKKKETPVDKEAKIVLLCTSLDDSQKELFQKFTQMLKVESVEDFSPEVTHIVTSCDANGQCIRTLKILQGILAGKWIVSTQWMEVCLEYKKMVSEEAFEIPGTKQMPNTFGPKLSRENTLNQNPLLFDGCSFYIYGQIAPPLPSKDNICQLIQLGGGKLLSREPRAEKIDEEEYIVPYHAAGGPLSDICYYILYQEKPPRNVHIRTNHICTVPVRWFIESICAFKFLNPDK